jgi:glucose-6-phosphate dehydrogenase assembly protein OpcA
MAEIVDQLGSLSAKLAHGEAGDDEHPHPRNCVMNMVALVDGSHVAEKVASIMADLAAHHPSRSIILHQHSPDREQRIDASIRCDAHALLHGEPVQHEQVTLHVQGAALDHVRSLVEPLLTPDVRTHLWWTGTPPLDDPAMHQALDLCEMLVVDSAAFERPFQSLLALAKLADEVSGQIGIADLHWARVHAWREVLAQFFEPPSRRPFLHGINGVGIDYAGEGRGNRVAAGLLTGWLCSTLGWRLKSAAAGSGGVVAAYLEAPAGHPVEIAFRSLPAAGHPEGEVLALRIDAAANRQTASLAIELDREHEGSAVLRYSIGHEGPLQQRLPIAASEEAELLVQLLVQGHRDPVFLRALRAAADLLQSAK